jgi:hypothetical protein
MPEEDKTFDDFFQEALSQDKDLDKGASGDDTADDATGNDENAGEEKSQQKREEEEGKSIFRRVPDDDDGKKKKSEKDNSEEDDDSTDYKSLYEQTKSELDEVKDQLKKEQHKTSSWQGRITKANSRADAAEKKAEQLQAEVDRLKQSGSGQGDSGEDPLTKNLTGKDKEMLEEFQSDFPDFVGPMKAISAAMAKSMLAEMKPSASSEDAESGASKKHQQEDYDEDFEGTGDESEASDQDAATKAHLKAIEKVHPDWKEIAQSGKLKRWIDGQDFWVKRQLLEVAQRGTADEVIEMLTEYKKAQGISTGDESGEGSENNSNEKSGGNSEAESFMAVEGSPSSGPSKKEEKSPDDFDSGWDEAVKS